MGITERICIYLDFKKITRYRFYKETGLSNGFLDKKGNIGSDKCERIIYQYKDLNPDWLLTGQGSMLREYSYIEPDNWIKWSKPSHQSNYRLDKSGLRLVEIAKQKNIEQFELRNLIGADDDFDKMIAGEIPVTEIVIDKILDIYPDISAKWIYTGHGDMFNTITKSTQQSAIPQQESNIIALLKEQLKEKEKRIEEQAQEIGMLKNENRKLTEQVMGLDVSGCKSSTSPSQPPSKDALSVTAHL